MFTLLALTGLAALAAADGEVGIDDALAPGDALPSGFEAPFPEAGMSLGSARACALQFDPSVPVGGKPFCWRSDEPLDGETEPPAEVFVQVSCGGRACCALRVDGSVACWGYGALARAPQGLFRQISVGDKSACGVLSSGQLRCWGKDHYGHIEKLPAGRDFVQVSSGKAHACALRADGSAECWGSKQFKALGVPDGVRFKQVAAAQGGFSCGLTLADESVLCWGKFFHNEGEPRPGPWAQLSLGRRHTCAMRPDGEVHCWGQPVQSFQSEHEDAVPLAESVVAGDDGLCLVRADDQGVWCYGRSGRVPQVPDGVVVG